MKHIIDHTNITYSYTRKHFVNNEHYTVTKTKEHSIYGHTAWVIKQSLELWKLNSPVTQLIHRPITDRE